MAKTKTILIIEDEENLVELLKYRLEANGYKVESALDGVSGLDKVKKLHPSLVILDIMLPKMHGYDVCRLMGEDKKIKKIPIIILSAHARARELEGMRNCGADSFIEKPFEPSELLDEIERLLK